VGSGVLSPGSASAEFRDVCEKVWFVSDGDVTGKVCP
jgi:hypothetical protein